MEVLRARLISTVPFVQAYVFRSETRHAFRLSRIADGLGDFRYLAISVERSDLLAPGIAIATPPDARAGCVALPKS